MVGIYWISTVDICRRICDIPHGPLCDNCNIAVFFPRTRERNSKKIFLATDDWCNYRRRPGGWINHPVLTCPFAPRPPLVMRGAIHNLSLRTATQSTHLSLRVKRSNPVNNARAYARLYYNWIATVAALSRDDKMRSPRHLRWLAMTRNKNAGKGPRNSFSLLHCNNICTLY